MRVLEVWMELRKRDLGVSSVSNYEHGPPPSSPPFKETSKSSIDKYLVPLGVDPDFNAVKVNNAFFSF